MTIENIKDIKPPVSFPANHFLLIAAAVVAILAGLAFLVYFLRKRFKKELVKPSLPPKPAHQVAYEALAALRAKDLPGQGKVKQYYIELSSIARHYLENRFGIRAPEMTTEEFLSTLRVSEDLRGAHKNLLKEFLNHCDIVKFAGYGPRREEIEESFGAAKALVDETKIAEERIAGK